MVLQYLQPTNLFLRGGAQQDATNGRCYDDSNGKGGKRKHSVRKSKSLLFPLAHVLKSSADLVQSAVWQPRGDGLTDQERQEKARKEERQQILLSRLRNAETGDEWRAIAKELDILEDNEAWKADPESPEYDYELLSIRLKALDDARTNCDVKEMLYLVRNALSRNIGGMGSVLLYKHSRIGTKYLIERYVDSVAETIRALVRLSAHTLPEGTRPEDILEQVKFARQAFGRSALLLSGGATFGMNHVGVLKALFQARLLPRIISGASAGSIICSVLCTRTDEEIPDLLKSFPYGNLAVFEEEGNEDGLLVRVGRLLTKGSWIDVKHLVGVMRELLGDMTFQEAYNRTRRILNICVSSASVYELPRLLNYITAPNVMIWSAVAASCSVPLLFTAAHLLVKDPLTGDHLPWNPTPQYWIDGSIDNDLPMAKLSEMFNVNHFIVSQVNPHVVPFLEKEDESLTHQAESSTTASDRLYKLAMFAKGEVLYRMHMFADMGVFPTLASKCASILSQKYSGDITILPALDFGNIPRILKNPDSEFMLNACISGERATWPKISCIKNHLAVELELDSAVQQLTARVHFSPSQTDLRRMSTGTIHTLPAPAPSTTAARGRDRRSLFSRRRHASNNDLHSILSAGDDELSNPSSEENLFELAACKKTQSNPTQTRPTPNISNTSARRRSGGNILDPHLMLDGTSEIIPAFKSAPLMNVHFLNETRLDSASASPSVQQAQKQNIGARQNRKPRPKLVLQRASNSSKDAALHTESSVAGSTTQFSAPSSDADIDSPFSDISMSPHGGVTINNTEIQADDYVSHDAPSASSAPYAPNNHALVIRNDSRLEKAEEDEDEETITPAHSDGINSDTDGAFWPSTVGDFRSSQPASPYLERRGVGIANGLISRSVVLDEKDKNRGLCLGLGACGDKKERMSEVERRYRRLFHGADV